MEIVIQPDAEAASLLVARIAAKELRANPRLVLGLATGVNMEAVYRHLVRLHWKEQLDFSLCRTFNVDDYVGLGPDDPHSCREYMCRNFLRHVNIDLRNAHMPNGTARDLDAECVRYQRLISRFGIDLQLLGLSRNGNIGFNEPLSALRSATRVKALSPQTLEEIAPLFSDPDGTPRRAITMGMGTILETRRCVLLATGSEKAEVVAKALEGPLTSMISASALQLHPRCTVVVDAAAASCLQHAEYYRWVFENEPEWDAFR